MSEKIAKICVLGLNQGSKTVRDVIANPRAEIVATAGFGEQAEEFAREVGVKRYDDYQELLREEVGNADGVVISLPNKLHLPATKYAVEQGWKHILLEKPIANDADEAREIIRLCKEAGATLLIGHHRRSASRYQALRKLIDSGRLGDIVSIQSSFAIEKQPDYWDKYLWHRERTGGPIMCNAIHDMDDLSFLTGLKAKRVFAILNNTIRGYEAEDSGTVVVEYEGGVVASYFISDGTPGPWNYDLAAGENYWWHSCPGENSIRIYGTKGSVGFPNMDFYYYEEGHSGWLEDMKHEQIIVQKNDPMAAELDHFVDLVLGVTDKPRCTGEDGLQAVQIMDAIFKSSDSGLPVEID